MQWFHLPTPGMLYAGSAKRNRGVNEVGGKMRAGPALNPLKGSSARLPPSGRYIRTPLAKPKLLKGHAFPKRPPVKKARPGKKCQRPEDVIHIAVLTPFPSLVTLVDYSGRI